ncbi:MAG TPA: RNA-binding cell elongation regulator Jag/EloR [Candidatus Limnocylindria bacterium]|nr:RNA-binding cell elongation regulator Jag/EloR [Candidatus Limnocylindria bacterium]
MTFREFTGKNVEEAIRAAMAEFSADLSDLDIEILGQGSRGILGVGGEEARILAAPKSAVAAADTVRAEAPAAPPPARPSRRAAVPVEQPSGADDEADAVAPPVDSAAEPADADVDVAADADAQVAELAAADTGRRSRGGRGRGGRGRNGREREHAIREPRPDRAPREPRGDRPSRDPAPFVSGKPVEELSDDERSTLDTATSVLSEMLSLMGLEGTVEVASGGETARLNVKGDDLGALIGRRGEKLASLQHIVNLIVGRREGQHHRIAIDVENYRGRREEQLRDVADRAAKRVIQTGKIIQLEAMPAVERRIVHMALLENGKVRTQSVGVEPNRRIVVLPASQVKD